MKSFKRAEYYDYNVIGVIVLLIAFGLVMLYSTTYYTAAIHKSDDMFYLKRQLLFSVISVGAAVILSFVDYRKLWRMSRIFYVFSLILILLTKSPLGKVVNGASRWLAFGSLTLQPTETAKLAVIIYVPVLIIRNADKDRGWRRTIEPVLAGLLPAALSVIITSSLSAAIIIMLITMSIIFIAHPKTAAFVLLVIALAGIAVLLVFLIDSDVIDLGFRSIRIKAWLHPEQYPKSSDQVLEGLYAIGSGGLFGKGLGNSLQKMGSVSEAANDMIFSIICEELGIFGGIIVIVLFIYLLYRLFYIAQNAPDLYGSLMVCGVFIHIASQAVLNICVVLNVIPTTGITLPFISYGGTSVTFLMMEIAIALSVSFKIRFKNQERDLWGEVVRDHRGTGV